MNQAALSPLARDLVAATVVFLVAVPLCLGISLASGAPLLSGVVAGVVGGVVVGALSGSQTSVSGPAVGLSTVVLAELVVLGSFEALLLALVFAGLLQIVLGVLRAGALLEFVPTSVVKGLLWAFGMILILKQIPHLLGRDTDPEGQLAFLQPDHENTFSELMRAADSFHAGVAATGALSLAVLFAWPRWGTWRRYRALGPVVVVLVGVVVAALFEGLGEPWAIGANHRVEVPMARDWAGLLGLLPRPSLASWNDPAVYKAGLAIALVASIETLLNLEALDKIDPEQRESPPNRELVAQGVGNVVCGLLGGIPVTSSIVRGSVSLAAGAASQRAAIFHGGLLAIAVAFLPNALNRIPLASLAAILLLAGFRLANPALVRQMWSAGRDQFVPFAGTVLAIVFTDPLSGLALGLFLGVTLILRRHVRSPFRRVAERHLDGEVLRIVLPDQLSFLHQIALERTLEAVPRGSQVLLDAERTEYIDPDVLALIREFRDVVAPARKIRLSMTGFEAQSRLEDEILYVDYSTRELQDRVTPSQVLELLREGNRRFATGRRLNRDFARQLGRSAMGQYPLAVVLSCIDSRTPAELVFDLGLGDIFSVRVAGNVISPKVLGSMEYGCAVAGARLVVVLGHTRCGAVTAAVDLAGGADVPANASCQHLHPILSDIRRGADLGAAFEGAEPIDRWPLERRLAFVDDMARQNVKSVVRQIVRDSETMADLVARGRIAIVGVLYDVADGTMEFLVDDAVGLRPRLS